MKALLAVLAFLALQAHAQTMVPIALQVEQLAPQLVSFVGSRGNFENLVNGLALGAPITLSTVGADGEVQTAAFGLAGGAVADPAEIARVLENARRQLLARGITTPTAQELAEQIAGTTVPATVAAAPAARAKTGVPVPLQVERLAPQLLAFAGSRGNFENLVNGLALGVPVTLTTEGDAGVMQTVTFGLPGGAVSDPAEIARALEDARRQLLARGVATPTAQQLAEQISGTAVPVTVGVVPAQPAAGAGASPAQQIQSRKTQPTPHTSDSPIQGTSDTPAPATSSAVPAPPPVKSAPSQLPPVRR